MEQSNPTDFSTPQDPNSSVNTWLDERTDVWDNSPGYNHLFNNKLPLVVTNIAIENGT